MKQFFLPFKNKWCDLFHVENNIHVHVFLHTSKYRELGKYLPLALDLFRSSSDDLSPLLNLLSGCLTVKHSVY